MVFHDKFNPLPADGCPGGEFEEKRRADDNEHTVRSRLNTYHEQTSPLAHWYGEGEYCTQSMEIERDLVTVDIINALN